MPWMEVALAKSLTVVAAALHGFRPPPAFLEEGLEPIIAPDQMAYWKHWRHKLMSWSYPHTHHFVRDHEYFNANWKYQRELILWWSFDNKILLMADLIFKLTVSLNDLLVCEWQNGKGLSFNEFGLAWILGHFLLMSDLNLIVKGIQHFVF